VKSSSSAGPIFNVASRNAGMSFVRGWSSGSPSGMATNSIAELQGGVLCKGQTCHDITPPTRQKLLQYRDNVCTRCICKILKSVIDQETVPHRHATD
jgi:hypothetical protein